MKRIVKCIIIVLLLAALSIPFSHAYASGRDGTRVSPHEELIMPSYSRHYAGIPELLSTLFPGKQPPIPLELELTYFIIHPGLLDLEVDETGGEIIRRWMDDNAETVDSIRKEYSNFVSTHGTAYGVNVPTDLETVDHNYVGIFSRIHYMIGMLSVMLNMTGDGGKSLDEFRKKLPEMNLDDVSYFLIQHYVIEKLKSEADFTPLIAELDKHYLPLIQRYRMEFGRVHAAYVRFYKIPASKVAKIKLDYILIKNAYFTIFGENYIICPTAHDLDSPLFDSKLVISHELSHVYSGGDMLNGLLFKGDFDYFYEFAWRYFIAPKNSNVYRLLVKNADQASSVEILDKMSGLKPKNINVMELYAQMTAMTFCDGYYKNTDFLDAEYPALITVFYKFFRQCLADDGLEPGYLISNVGGTMTHLRSYAYKFGVDSLPGLLAASSLFVK